MTGSETNFGLVRQPASVLFGPGQRSQLPHAARRLARHVLIVTDERMAASADFDEMRSAIEAAGLQVSVFGRAQPDLPRSSVLEAVAAHAGSDIDGVVGVGGGSCLDLAKVVAVILSNGGDVRDLYGEFRVPAAGLPVIAVPTTGGTGAEVTSIAVVFDDEAGMKMGVADPYLEPAFAIIDPELTVSCPPGLTAATAADALSHVVESYTCRDKAPGPADIAGKLYVGKNRITDVFCAEGFKAIAGGLEAVVATPGDLSARTEMMFGAYCAGMAINTTGTAAAHALQAPMAAHCHASHGFGVGALLPYVMRFNLPERVEAFARIAGFLGVSEGDVPVEAAARAAIERIESLLLTAGVPADLRGLGLDRADIPAVAAGAMKATRLTVNNPREMTEESMARLLERAYDGDRSWWAAP